MKVIALSPAEEILLYFLRQITFLPRVKQGMRKKRPVTAEATGDADFLLPQRRLTTIHDI